MTADLSDFTVALLDLSGCPCCAGRDSGGWMELCDPCLSAALAGGCAHDRERGGTP